ncbi:MAG: hypothetical protein RLZ92_1333 [Pseudomonadota bacterium]|jgi:hypothetical protein
MIHQFRIYQEEDFSGKIENKLDPKKLENTLTDYFENPYNFYSDSISIEF